MKARIYNPDLARSVKNSSHVLLNFRVNPTQAFTTALSILNDDERLLSIDEHIDNTIVGDKNKERNSCF